MSGGQGNSLPSNRSNPAHIGQYQFEIESNGVKSGGGDSSSSSYRMLKENKIEDSKVDN